jgi:ribose transport system permease protein
VIGAGTEQRGPRLPREVAFALVALGLVLALGAVFNAEGVFFRPAIHADALWQIAGFGILACGMTVVILTGGIDLSVGSVAALCGVIFAILTMRLSAPGWLAIPAAMAAGALLGAANGALVALLRMQPFIATLAMMAFARGLAKSNLLSGGVKVQRMPAPPIVEAINAKIPILGVDVSVAVFVFLAGFAAAAVVLRGLRFGRHVYALGDNPEAARLSGVPARATLVAAYGICGLFAGVAGLLFAAIERQGNPDGGVGYELTAIAMVVVGGTSLSGGRGGVTLTILGALTIGYLRKILDINGIQTPGQLMITGCIIAAAVLVQGLRR